MLYPLRCAGPPLFTKGKRPRFTPPCGAERKACGLPRSIRCVPQHCRGLHLKMRCQAGVGHPAGCTPAPLRYPVPPASPHPRWPIRSGFTRRAVHCRKRGLGNAPSPGKRRIRAFAVAGIRVAAARQRYRSRHTPARAFDLQPRMGKTEIPPGGKPLGELCNADDAVVHLYAELRRQSRLDIAYQRFRTFFGPGEHVDLARPCRFRQIPPGPPARLPGGRSAPARAFQYRTSTASLHPQPRGGWINTPNLIPS